MKSNLLKGGLAVALMVCAGGLLKNISADENPTSPAKSRYTEGFTETADGYTGVRSNSLGLRYYSLMTIGKAEPNKAQARLDTNKDVIVPDDGVSLEAFFIVTMGSGSKTLILGIAGPQGFFISGYSANAIRDILKDQSPVDQPTWDKVFREEFMRHTKLMTFSLRIANDFMRFEVPGFPQRFYTFSPKYLDYEFSEGREMPANETLSDSFFSLIGHHLRAISPAQAINRNTLARVGFTDAAMAQLESIIADRKYGGNPGDYVEADERARLERTRETLRLIQQLSKSQP